MDITVKREVSPDRGRAAVTKPSRARVARIRDRLREVYGRPYAPPHGQGLDELILTVLSQSTSDRNRDVAFLRLREHFDSWAAVRDAPNAEVEAAIRPGGISKVKSVRIQAILRELDDPPSIDHLAQASVEQGRAELIALPGVGRKTAACVLLFAYGKRDVPVDTHVSRVGTRLGLLRAGAPFEELHDAMLALTPRGQELELHVNLLRHGRRTCHARRPDCDGCALLRMCPTGYNLRHAD
jgi:endonuclease III